MKVVYRKRFLKDLAGIPSSYRQRIETFVFEDLPARVLHRREIYRKFP